MGLKVTAILLAAGLSRRMGADKLLLPYRGKTILQTAVGLLSVLPVYEKILVTDSMRLDKVLLPPEIRAEINRNPETGQSGSLKLGISASAGDCWLFMAADQPRLTVWDLQPLLDTAGANADKIICPCINMNPCTPALFPARFRAELLNITGDTGGKPVREAHPEACLLVEAKFPAHFLDVDDMDDYQTVIQDNG